MKKHKNNISIIDDESKKIPLTLKGNNIIIFEQLTIYITRKINDDGV